MKRMFRALMAGLTAAPLALGSRGIRHDRSRPPASAEDQPGVQFYIGNFLTETLVGISDHIYRQTDGYAFETQHFPNSPNQPNFPSTELKPGQQFTRRRSSSSHAEGRTLTP